MPPIRPEFIPLESILYGNRSKDHVVAFENGHPLRWEEFLSHVSGLSLFLDPLKPGPWMVSCSSSFAFLVGIYSLWSRGLTCLLPPNHQPETISELARTCVSGIITDGLAGISGLIPGVPSIHPLQHKREQTNLIPIDRNSVLVELYTSGSTGERKRVPKKLGQLSDEIQSLENLFGPRLEDGVIVSTVSHQHIYGLLFRLLWPLCSGRPFDSSTSLFWPSIQKSMALHPKSILVTSPSHLERVEESGHSQQVLAVFSSGGLLHKEVSLRSAQALTTAPIEIFGSTETGGVGWRVQSAGDNSSPWEPLPGVSLSEIETGNLRVTSPYTGDVPVVLGDLGTIHPDGKFSILGRSDRIVKRGEKKVSLTEIETRLNAHPFAQEAHVLLLQTGPSEPILGAAVQLTAAGQSFLADKGTKDLVVELRTHLLKYFDPTLLPKRFRWFDSFSKDSQGKITRQSLIHRFDSTTPSEPVDPVIKMKRFSENEAFLEGLIPANLFYFNGHFPRFSIVPGIVQIKWAIHFFEMWLGRPIEPSGLEAIKFKNPMRPGASFSLKLLSRQTSESRSLEFTFSNGEMVYGSGRILVS